MAEQPNQEEQIPQEEEIIDEVADAALVDPDHGIELEANNYYLDPAQFRPNPQHVVLLDILTRHPIRHALTRTTDVPLIYVLQVWNTAQVRTLDGVQTITAQIDNQPFSLTPASFRQLLALPEATANNHARYDPAVNDTTLCAQIRALGYNAELPRPSAFNRKYLAPLWYTLFTILNRCLSARWKGIDQCTGDFLRLVHAVCYNRHVDFAMIIWRELVTAIRNIGGTKQKKFLPYPRFLSLAVRQHMDANPAIPRRAAHPVCPIRYLQFLVIRNVSAAVAMPIPDALLAVADPAAPGVVAYRGELGNPMVQPAPEGPSPGHRTCEKEGVKVETEPRKIEP